MEEESGDGIREALASMKAGREWDRANPSNPVCLGCQRRERLEDLTEGLCIECEDSILFLNTGCRFGKIPCCGNDDCRLPFAPDELARLEEIARLRKTEG
ncbi:hypothetical protein ABZ281_07665 [Streptomyces sp. NPDC006265]|uniref:hypothetical protein n=1 Tax=Streptomyces sp. NPDC006265 TaxID=3156740 RepID=UPI00339F56DD